MKKTTITFLSSLTLSMTLGLGALLTPAISFAQDSPPAEQAPHKHLGQPAQAQGNISRYLVGPMGHVRGFLLDNGTTVFVGGKQGDGLAQAVPVGQGVRVEGFSGAMNPGVIRRATVYAKDGTAVAAPPQRQGRQRLSREERTAHRAQKRQQIEQLPAYQDKGAVQTVLFGRRASIRGLVLSDGTTVFMGRQLGRALSAHGVRQGDTIAATGHGNAYPQGASLFASQLTLPDGSVLSASAPAPAAR
jgi:hypothetical protein